MGQKLQYDDMTFYLKLFVLLYADDTVVYGIGEKDIQNNLDIRVE